MVVEIGLREGLVARRHPQTAWVAVNSQPWAVVPGPTIFYFGQVGR